MLYSFSTENLYVLSSFDQFSTDIYWNDDSLLLLSSSLLLFKYHWRIQRGTTGFSFWVPVLSFWHKTFLKQSRLGSQHPLRGLASPFSPSEILDSSLMIVSNILHARTSCNNLGTATFATDVWRPQSENERQISTAIANSGALFQILDASLILRRRKCFKFQWMGLMWIGNCMTALWKNGMRMMIILIWLTLDHAVFMLCMELSGLVCRR